MEAPLACVASAQLGKARRIDDAAGRYIEFCKSTFPSELDLRGLRIVVDCAHGAGLSRRAARVPRTRRRRDRRRRRSRRHSTSTRASAPRIRSYPGRAGARPSRRPGARAGWRRRPAGDGGPRRRALRRRPAPLRDRHRLPAPRRGQRRRRRHADEQPGIRAGAGARRHCARARAASATATCSSSCGSGRGCWAARTRAM